MSRRSVHAHTHKPWVHECGGAVFVNSGSVGKPKDGDSRASFAVLSESEPASPSATRLTADRAGAA